MISVQVVGGITVCDVLATAEELMVVDLERDTSNDPYGQTAGRRRNTVFPCQRRQTYFDYLRYVYGEAGLLKSQSGEDVWELRFGPRVTCELNKSSRQKRCLAVIFGRILKFSWSYAIAGR